jgi:hypothetical protein
MEPDVGVEAALGRFLAQLGNASCAGIVGREREQGLVQIGHGLLAVVIVDHPAHVLDPAVDVRLDLADVADGELLAGGRHDLHHPDGTHRALGVLVKLGFLVSLRRHQQPVDIVFVTVLLEISNQGEEFLALGLGSGVLHILCAFQVTLQERIPDCSALGVAGQEIVDRRLELRAALAYRPGDVTTAAHRDVVVHRDLGEDLLPEVGLVLVHDDQWDQPGVHHLDEILVLQFFRRWLDDHAGFLLCGQALVERHQALVIAGGLAHEDFLARQVFHALQRGCAGAGHHHLADVGIHRHGKIHQLLAVRGNREVGRRDIALAVGQRLQQFAAGDRDENHPHLEMLLLQFLLLGQPFVQILLEHAERVVGRAALDALVREIKGLAISRQHANHPALDHPVEIAFPWLHGLGEIDGQILPSGLLRCSLLRRRRRGGEQQQNSWQPGRPQGHWKETHACSDFLEVSGTPRGAAHCAAFVGCGERRRVDPRSW